jgi:transposase-like protein
MKTYRKNKTFTDEQKQEIISYALEHGMWSVKKQFNVWPETVRYWIDPNLREVKKRQNKIKSLE